MSDLISRSKLLEELKKSRGYHAETGRDLSLLIRCENIVNEQPSVEVPQWIPCSERLPDEDETVLCLEGLSGNFYLGRLWNEFDGIRWVDSEGFTICDVDI